MLETIRKRRKGIFGTFILVIVALTMFGFGVDFMSNSSARQVAIRVGKTEFSTLDYQRKLYQLQELFKRQFGAQYDQFASSLNLEQQTIDQMIRQELFAQFTASLGLVASEKSVKEEILQHPFFKQSGATQQTYNALLRGLGMSEAVFKEQIEKKVIEDQLQQLLIDLNEPSKIEIQAAMKEEKRKASFRYVKFSPEDFLTKVELTEEALKAHYIDTAEQYRKPRSVRYDSVIFNPQQFIEKVEFSNADIEDTYQKNLKNFVEEKKISLRQLTIKKEPSKDKEGKTKEASQVDIQNKKNKEKAEAALKRIEAGEAFAEVAKQLSEDETTKKSGGSLGWQSYSQLNPILRQAVSNLEVGQNSKVLDNFDSYSIVLVEGYQDQRQKPLEEVKAEVQLIFQEELAPEYAQIAANEFLEKIKGKNSVTENFKTISEQLGYKVTESGGFVSDELAGNMPEEITAQALKLAVGEKALLTAGDSAYVIDISEIKDSYIPEFEEAKPLVEANYKGIQAQNLAKKIAEEVLANLTKTAPDANGSVLIPAVKTLSQTNLIPVITTKVFSKNEQNSEFQVPELKTAAFGLTLETPRTLRLIETGESSYLLELATEELPKEQELLNPNKELFQKEAENSANRIFEAMMETLKIKADVWVNPELYEKRG
jgi:peptidyl-prolyl cis-trans isomerase D